MGNFKYHKKTGFGKRYEHGDSGRSGYGGNRGDREMFEAVCSMCGKTATVPFRPNGKKPVFCNDCFRKNGAGAGEERRSDFVKRPDYGKRYGFEKRPDTRPQNNEQIKALEKKIDRITEMLVTLLVSTKKGSGKTDEKTASPKKAKKPQNATPLALPDAAKTA